MGLAKKKRSALREIDTGDCLLELCLENWMETMSPTHSNKAKAMTGNTMMGWRLIWGHHWHWMRLGARCTHWHWRTGGDVCYLLVDAHIVVGHLLWGNLSKPMTIIGRWRRLCLGWMKLGTPWKLILRKRPPLAATSWAELFIPKDVDEIIGCDHGQAGYVMMGWQGRYCPL